MGSVGRKTVFITGGARGIGAEVARKLHGRGANVFLTDLDEPALVELVARLGGDRVRFAVGDVRDPDAMKSAANAAVEQFGGIDVVVANAGIGSFGSVLNIDPAAFKRVIDVNVLGVFNTVHAALPAIIERRGYVLAVSSLAAFAAAPGQAANAASKAGVENFANALRLEVAHVGVAVGSAHMSWIDTPLVQDARAELSMFDQMLASLPGPLRKTSSVDECGATFVKGIEGRRRRVYCPGWVGVFRWLRPALATAIAERDFRRQAPEFVDQIDAEAKMLGRHFTARTEALEKP